MKSQGLIIRSTKSSNYFHVILIILCITLYQSYGINERYLSNTYKKEEDTENIKDIRENQNDQSGESIDSVNHHKSIKITNESDDSPALRSFLKNILKARDELKWIDHAAGATANNRLNQPNPFLQSNKVIIDKRHATKEEIPSNEIRTFALNEPLNFNKNLRYGRSNNRWIRDYAIPYTNNDITDLKIDTPNKRESSKTEESLEELKRTILELKENLTSRNENSDRNKAMEKAILNNKEKDKFIEDDSDKRIISESPEDMNESEKSSNNVENQDRSSILLRNKRTNLRNDHFNDMEMNLYKRKKRSKENINKENNLNDDSYYDKTIKDNNNNKNYWKTNNYKELTNVDDLIAQQAKLFDYANINNNINNKNVLSESERIIKRKSPIRRLFGIIEKQSNNRSLSDNNNNNNNDNNCFIGKKHLRKILQTYDEDNLEEDFPLTKEENDLERNEISSKVAKSCHGKNDERKLDYQKTQINRDERERGNIIEENLEGNEDDENDEKENLKVERDVKNMSENVKNSYDARVNMMIKQRIALRHKDDKNHIRRKRYPLGIIEYYDYDEEINERSRESQIIGDNDQKNTNQNDNPIDSSFKLDASLREAQNETLMKKKNEEAEEKEKEKKRKEQMENKVPKQQFLIEQEQQARAKNENPSESLRNSKVTLEGVDKGVKKEVDDNKSLQMDREKLILNEAVQPSGQIRDEKSFVPGCQTKWSNNKKKEQDENERIMEEPNQEIVNIDKMLPKDSLEYILRAPENLQREIVDVVFGDVQQPIQLPEHDKKLDNFDQTRLENRIGSKKLDEKEYEDIDNVYDELKKLYDWEDNENKNGPRLKGDQRMHPDASEDELEIKANDNNNNNNNNNNNSNNTSESNYLALKKTDDLFKGGLEQSDIFEERSSNRSQNQHHHHHHHPNHQNLNNNYTGNIEWKVIPVVETINDSHSKSSGVVRSGLSKRKTAPENDSGSPYENGKYHDTMNELEENVPNVIDGDKRSILESKDMHESFVEPMDRIDDFDDDVKIRLGRGLKTIDDNYLKNNTINNYTNKIQSIDEEHFTTTMKTTNISTKYEIILHSSSPSSSSSLDNSNVTVKNEMNSMKYQNNENNSNVNNIIDNNSNRFNVTMKAQILANRNASRVKRDGNFYSLNYNNHGKNPYESYYYNRRSKDLTNDIYTINPYEYNNNNDIDLKYNNDINNIYHNENKVDIFKDKNIQDVNNRKKKKKKRNKMHNKKKRKKKKKKMKLNQKKNNNKKKMKKKKNSNWKITKKRARNLNNKLNDLYDDSLKIQKKRWKNNPIANYRNNNWKDRVKKWQQQQEKRRRKNKMKMNKKKKKKKKKEKKKKQTDMTKIKDNHEIGIVKGIRRNSNNDGIIHKDNTKIRNTMRKKETENEDTHRKKLAMFLTADNMEDESQMDLALHGELAGKIVENIFEQVQRNEALKVALGPGLSKKNQHQDEILTDKIYHHRDLDENYIKHTEKTMKKIMELLGRLVLDEVQSKTCATLPPDMQQFLEWILQINGDKDLHIQTSSLLPLTTREQETTEHPVDDDKIISTKTPDEDIDKDLNEFQKKIRILKNLINEYNALSAKEKIKVQTVHDYLMRQLNLLLNYIEIKEKSNKNATSLVSRTAGVHGHNSGFIVRYQGESPKLKFDNNLTLIKDPNVSEYWKLNNTSFSLDIERNKRDRPIRSYYDNYVKSKKKRKKRKKHQRKRRRRRNEINYDKRRDDTPEYRKLARRAAAMIREKRDDNLDDEWNQFDFKYEQPKIYKSMNIIKEPIEKIRNERSIDLQPKKKKRATLETNNITITNFVNNHFDDLPVKGKNLAEDEMILLNKREAWKKENERQLEEVAFGKDMRNKIKEEEQFKRLIEIKGNKMTNELNKLREKRENLQKEANFIIPSNSNNVTMLNINVTTVSYNELNIANLSSNCVDNKIISLEKLNNTNENEEKLKIMKPKINVFSDDKNDTSIMNQIII